MKLYLLSCTNYATHDQAEVAFSVWHGKAHLALHKDRTASINTLVEKAPDKGQVEYNPIGTDGRYNF